MLWKQTQNTRAWSLAEEEAMAYSLARRKEVAVTRDSERRRRDFWREREGDGSLALGLEISETIAKQKQLPSAGLDSMRAART